MKIVDLVDGITAHFGFLLLLVVSLKFVTKRLHIKKVDIQLMKIHKPASDALITLGVVHMFTSLFYFSMADILTYVVGLFSLLAMIGAIFTFKMRKKHTKWLVYHRVLTIVAIITCIAHPIIYHRF